MTTIQDVIGDYTPLSNNVVKELKLIRGALACKIFYTSNLRDRVCRMGLNRIADELGIDHTTASKNIKWLIDNEYIELVKEHTNRDPAHYRCTQKFYDLAGGVDLINPGLDVINSRVDLINQEEESEKELKHKERQSRPPVIPALKIFVDVTGKYSLSKPQIKELDKRIGNEPNNLERWRQVVHSWVVLHGYKPTNLAGMLEWYDKGIPQFNNGNGREKTPAIVAGPVNDEYGGYYA